MLMKCAGYIGSENGPAFCWLQKLSSHICACREQIPAKDADYYLKSFERSKEKHPGLSFKLAWEDAAAEGCIPLPGGFSVAVCPDRGAVELTPAALGLRRLYLEGAAGGAGFLTEILFSPKCPTLGSFALEAAEIFLLDAPRPASVEDWAADTLARRAAAFAAEEALLCWTKKLKRAAASGAPGRTPAALEEIFIKELEKTAGELETERLGNAGPAGRGRTAPFRLFASKHGEDVRSAASALLRSALADRFPCAVPGPSPLFASRRRGACIVCSASDGSQDGSAGYMRWLLRAAALYPDVTVYALGLERWPARALDALVDAVRIGGPSCVALWTSAVRCCVPEELLARSFVCGPQPGVEDGIVMLEIPKPGLEKEGEGAFVYENEGRRPGGAAPDAEYLMGRLAGGPEDARRAEAGERPAAKVPYAAAPWGDLPEDRIYEARKLAVAAAAEDGGEDADEIYKELSAAGVRDINGVKLEDFFREKADEEARRSVDALSEEAFGGWSAGYFEEDVLNNLLDDCLTDFSDDGGDADTGGEEKEK